MSNKKNDNMIRVNEDVKKELEKLKINNESFNSLFIRLIEENKKLNKILLNIEDLQTHIQETKPKPKENI